MKPIQSVQHTLRDANPENAAELETSFGHNDFDCSNAIISVTAVKPVVKPFYPLYL